MILFLNTDKKCYKLNYICRYLRNLPFFKKEEKNQKLLIYIRVILDPIISCNSAIGNMYKRVKKSFFITIIVIM